MVRDFISSGLKCSSQSSPINATANLPFGGLGGMGSLAGFGGLEGMAGMAGLGGIAGLGGFGGLGNFGANPRVLICGSRLHDQASELQR